MNNLTKLIALIIMSLAITHCGSKGGGGSDPAPKANNNVTANTAEIQFDSGTGIPVIVSIDGQNVYIPQNNGCVLSLKTSSDDTSAQQAIAELIGLIESSTVSKGTKDNPSFAATFITIRYKDGNNKTYNLDNDLAAKDEEVLSNGAQIKQLLFEIAEQIDTQKNISCPTGK